MMLRHIATGGGALDETAEPTEAGRVEGVRITLSAASAAENLTISLVSASGSEYNITLDVKAMSGVTYYVWQPTRPHPFFKGDSIRVQYANSSANTWGLEILWT